MEPHDRPLLVRERSRFLEDPVGDTDLPDVVEERAAADVDQRLLGHPGAPREVERPVDDALRVPLRLLVAQVEGVHPPLEGGVVGLGELLGGPLQLADEAGVGDGDRRLLGEEADRLEVRRRRIDRAPRDSRRDSRGSPPSREPARR